MRLRTLTLTLATLVAFAANSVLCRMALKAGLIDPVSFTQLRLASGAAVLAPILFVARFDPRSLSPRDWGAAGALFIYAIGFSLAYVSLDAGPGALILFGAVQLSMIGVGVARGDRPGALQWAGLVLAFGGLVYLFLPGLTAPPLGGALLMAAAGIAWGVYSLLGRSEPDPVAATARNFVLTAPFIVVLFVAGADRHAALPGIALAIASGALASGMGYVIWYRALKGLSAMNAAVVQLAVPVIAALGGVAFIGEAVTLRLAVAAALILGGIFLSIRAGARKNTG